jgi:hypothetical protein
MKTLDVTSRAGGVVAVVVLSAALSGCYYYAPYGYVPYGEVAAAAPQQYPFSMPDARCSRSRSRYSRVRCDCVGDHLYRTTRARLRRTCVLPRRVSVLRPARVVGAVGVAELRLLGRLLLRWWPARLQGPPRLLGSRISRRLGRSWRLGWPRIPRAWYGWRPLPGRWRRPRAFALNANRDALVFNSSPDS